MPPSSECLDDLMTVFLDMANKLPRQINPVIAASVTSFGFVFLHPFMDETADCPVFYFINNCVYRGNYKKDNYYRCQLP